ncbi:biopolymer transporter ExbD [Rubellicoccus peritrichatus]|uniref:Biopolymer transporter ExbD n=1 Tax=Rubellicoccus peritrichatus TaxID=3080537 RepID=A0AAQ3LF91_9BACT|nr:biopolymer transporter ExbD [Puniceicoccus sp. CR14]WOO43627.1 biopolymer transporter ExbD [Puniceicoccus sp. CR14]
MKIWKFNDEDGDIDLTPMIDVVFLLVVFFMTVANMISAEKHPITVPVALNSTIPDDYGERTTVTVTADGSLYAGVYPVDLEELAEILIAERERNPAARVFIRADSSTEHQYVNDVMQICAASGLSNVIFAAYQSDK